MSASLPMYDLPEVAAATDAWWSGLAGALRRQGLRDVPPRLQRDGAPQALWRAAGLLFTQTCGYPLMHAFAGRLKLVATPCYDAPGCQGPYYRSLVIVPASSAVRELAELRGETCAVNDLESQSGYSALRALVAPFSRGGRFFGGVQVTGSHLASLELVASGGAAVAAIDCVTHALVARHRPVALAGTRVLCDSAAAPGLPYVTAAATSEADLQRLRAGLQEAMQDPDLAPARAALLLKGAEVLPLTAYARIAEIEAEAVALGYPQVA